jgi:hypothetical protein
LKRRGVKLKSGMTAAQWLKHRQQLLLFLSLVVVALTIILVVALLRPERQPQTAVVDPLKTEPAPNPNPAGSGRKPVVYKTCEHPSFGRKGWQHSEVVDQSSGWRGGGGSPQNWCNDLAAAFIQRNSIGSDREVERSEAMRAIRETLWGASSITTAAGCGSAGNPSGTRGRMRFAEKRTKGG